MKSSQTLDRRGFLKLGVGAGAAAGLDCATGAGAVVAAAGVAAGNSTTSSAFESAVTCRRAVNRRAPVKPAVISTSAKRSFRNIAARIVA